MACTFTVPPVATSSAAEVDITDAGPSVARVSAFRVARSGRTLVASWRVTDPHGLVGFTVEAEAVPVLHRAVALARTSTYSVDIRHAQATSTELIGLLSSGGRVVLARSARR